MLYLLRYGVGMTLTTRLAAVIAAGLELAAARDAAAWQAPRPASPPQPEHPATGVSPPLPEQRKSSVRLPPGAPAPGRLIIFASGMVLAAAALMAAWMTLHESASSASDRLKTSNPARLAGVPASRPFAACPLQPAVPAAGEKDGQFPLQADVSGLIAADIASFIAIGKDAVAAGRLRDAEVAFLMACRTADKLKGADSVESADAKFQLGAHYAQLAVQPADPASRAELLRQAERFYADSSHTYLLTHGQADEVARFAAEGLATVRQRLAHGDSVPLSPLVTAAQPRQAGMQEEALHALPVPQDQGAAGRSGPSFDCTKARSVPEKMICSDAELARLDRDLARVYRRAGNLTADPTAFRRQTRQAWRLRETTCQDRECLLRWYAHRREQLMGVIHSRKQSPPRTSHWSAFPAETADLYKGQ